MAGRMILDDAEVLRRAEEFARAELEGDAGGHDWWHVHRVRNLAVSLAHEEGADAVVVELAALLHDVRDVKLSGSRTAGPDAARDFCRQNDRPELAERVSDIVAGVSFRGSGVPDVALDLEGRCVRDADRLDALGAIGVGRTFAYGGRVGRPMWDPTHAPVEHQDEDAYRAGRGSSIDHFHEKLLRLADRMGTVAGQRRAARRHDVVQRFLDEFTDEWEGRR